MIPKNQRKIIEQKKNSRSQIINNLNRKRIINKPSGGVVNFDNNVRKVVNRKKVGFSPFDISLPEGTLFYDGKILTYDEKIVTYDT